MEFKNVYLNDMKLTGFTIKPVANNPYGNFQVWMGDRYICTCVNEQDCKNFIDEL